VVTLGVKNNNPYSIELCGGTHVADVKDINKFLIINEESISSGVRRIEALTADHVDEYLLLKKKEKDKLEILQNENIANLEKKIQSLSGKINFQESNKAIYIKKLENYLETLKNKSILSSDSNNLITENEINGLNYITHVIDGLPPKELRSIYDKFKSEKQNSILACVTINEDKVSIVVGLTKDLTEKYDARILIKSSFSHLGSKGGGGRVDFAQAGGDQKSNINKAFLSIQEQI
jgi:alanyl-tRNA synthetase